MMTKNTNSELLSEEAKWWEQFTLMREALASAESDHEEGKEIYGKDIFPDSDFDSDYPSDLEEIYGFGDSADNKNERGPASYDKNWLSRRLEEHNSRMDSGMAAEILIDNVSQMLASKAQDDELQGSLTDVLGYEDFELIEAIIRHRHDLIKGPASDHDNLRGAKLLSKAEQEDRLRKMDKAHKSAPLLPQSYSSDPQYPHVYKVHQDGGGNTLNAFGKKYAVPKGTETKDTQSYEEITIPPAKVGTVQPGEKLVYISEMNKLCQGTFKGYKSLNRMQSLVYPVAYNTNENMLICAPTGAGKTDAAMLTILNVISRNCEPSPISSPDANHYNVLTDDFKIVYVAPMKALAAEVVEKLGKRLAWLGVEVRELTGDMQLTKAEVIRTQIIVTTPEKWDVVTRKSTGDTELVQKVRLLIIDEVHMLHDERGAVIEGLVARTQRQVEASQTMIRIVGLSATLPNYVDVAQFLRVNPYAGLFYFDASFRPIPLEQHFLGVKGKVNTRSFNENLDRTAFEKVREMLEQDHQVMVFVHSRKDTLKTAKTMYQLCVDENCTDLLDMSEHQNYKNMAKEMERSKARELRDLFKKGMGIHHAGMLRSDRNLMERMFANGMLRVLFCTATLAWGVNLPAAAVVIRGTQIYNPEKGKHMDLGILDVLQIFGRAGRPQFEKYGIGFICTSHDKLSHYLSVVTQQQPIESRLVERIVDNLNAEISLGTVTTVEEGVQWLGYSYMFVRWKRNPLAYGIDWADVGNDPQLVQKRRELIIRAARQLQKAQMIIFDEATEKLAPKDIGRIASNFYILHESVEIFNTLMKPNASEADVFHMLSMSGEFSQVQSRENEQTELGSLRENDHMVPCKFRDNTDSSQGKTNILMQAYISRANFQDFALVSDVNYVQKNSQRICRALFQMALGRRWGNLCDVLLSLCKSFEQRRWPFEHPLAQFDFPIPIIRHLNESDASIEYLKDLEPAEIGELVHNKKEGYNIAKLVQSFPLLAVDAEIAPLNRDVLRIKLYLTPQFKWNDRMHGTSESYYIWVENSETGEIYHHEFFILNRKKLNDEHELNFTIPLGEQLPTQIYVRASSDKWLGAETVTPVSFQHLIRPDTESFYTELLNLQPLPISALKNPKLEELYGSRFEYFNPMQTQLFHTLYHTKSNVLLGSPTGSGKTVACELAMWAAFRDAPKSKVVYIAPMKALVRERVKDWNPRLTKPMGLKLVELTGDNTPDTRSIRDADIIITTPEKWDGISRSWQTRDYVRKVSLVIIDEIHLLGGDRGPILEIIVSRMNYIASQTSQPVRLMGMSTACANAVDLGSWLGVKEGLFNFRHSVRPVPLEIYIDGFPEVKGFCPFMQSMNKPTFQAIKSHSPNKPVIVFVASRRQTRLTAKDLINFCGMEENPRRFLNMSDEDLTAIMTKVKDSTLKEALAFGIGLHHAGLVESDRQVVEELFTFNKIQVLIATSTLAWGVNLPAHLVVVKGTQFYDAKSEGYKDMDLTDVLQMLGRAGRPQFDSSGVARIFTQESKKSFYKYFLHTGFPVESSLHNVLDDHLGAEVSAGTIKSTQDALDYLTWTFFFRRLHKNPSYYGLQIETEDHAPLEPGQEANQFLIEMVEGSLHELQKSGCIKMVGKGELESTSLGKIASYYYLSHRTIRMLIRRAKKNATFQECLSWMCLAAEYDELPVRHNEDLINNELSKLLPFPGNSLGLPMWDPHVKAYLLLQAHMTSTEMPITDYNQDQISVLDQSIRILQASIDLLCELGYLSSCMTMVTVMQCVKMARMPDDWAVSVLPGVERDGILKRMVPADKNMPGTLMDVVLRPPGTLNRLVASLDIPKQTIPQFDRVAVNGLPNLDINVESEITGNAMTVTIVRKNRGLSADNRIYAPKFPKQQTEGYFVILGSEAKDEVYALKRVGWQSGGGSGGASSGSRYNKQEKGKGKNQGGSGGGGGAESSGLRAKATLTLPRGLGLEDHDSGGGSGKLTLFVISDGYLGMVWKKDC